MLIPLAVSMCWRRCGLVSHCFDHSLLIMNSWSWSVRRPPDLSTWLHSWSGGYRRDRARQSTRLGWKTVDCWPACPMPRWPPHFRHWRQWQTGALRCIGSRPSDHYFRSVCLFVCLFVQSFSQPSLIRFRSNLDICYMSGSSCVP